MNYLRLILLTLCLLFNTAFASDLIKLSKSGISHDTSCASYYKTKNFTAVLTLERVSMGYRVVIDFLMASASFRISPPYSIVASMFSVFSYKRSSIPFVAISAAISDSRSNSIKPRR